MAEIEIKPSQMIKEFLNFLEESKQKYDDSKNDVSERTKANIDYLHDIEFAENKNERNKIATVLHTNQIERRKSKDNQQKYEKIANFMNDVNNKGFIGRLKHLITEQQKIEDFLDGDRHYNRRSGDDDATT